MSPKPQPTPQSAAEVPGQGSAAPAYLAGLHLAGRRVVVLGGGGVAQRRVAGLLAARADVLVIAPTITIALQGLVESGQLGWEQRPYRAGDLADCWYAEVATDDPQVNAVAVAEAEAERVFAVRADHAASGTASTPATGRHGDLQVGVLGGGDPRRAAGLRDSVLDRLHEGSLVARRTREHPPQVTLVGGGPGDPDLITVRGRRALAEADVVVVDRLAPRELLDELPPDVEVVDAAKIPYGRYMAQDAINQVLVDRVRAGKNVARLKGGDLYVFGRGMEEVLYCAEAGIAVEVVPGLTSAIAVPALAGIPVTHRGVAHEFTVLSGHVAPDDPASLVDWSALGRQRGTLVLMMAVDRLGPIAAALISHGRPEETPVAVVADGSMPTERRLFATLATVADRVVAEGVRPPAIVVVGDVVDVASRYHHAVRAAQARAGA